MARKTRHILLNNSSKSSSRGTTKKKGSVASAAAAATADSPQPVPISSTAEKQPKHEPQQQREQQQEQQQQQQHELPPLLPPQSSFVAVSERDNEIRKRALVLLAERTELPVLYAALKRIREIGLGVCQATPDTKKHVIRKTKNNDGNSTSTDQKRQKISQQEQEEAEQRYLTGRELDLIRDASLAIPYLLYKRLYEQFMLPRTMGGLALSDAKAKLLAKDLFFTLGSDCCLDDTITEKHLEQCTSLKRMDARKIIPFLKFVRQETIARLEEIYRLLNNNQPDPTIPNNYNNNDNNMETVAN